MFNPIEAAKAQEEYCRKQNLPLFAPKSGVCWACSKNIYAPLERKAINPLTRETRTSISGITVEAAGSIHITGCPHCNRSYVD